MSFVSRGFRGRREDAPSDRVPPGQCVTRDFPVLSAGPTPHTRLDVWDFSIVGEVDEPRRWPWEEFRALPSEEVTVDIHCVTKWSKLDTVWEGVSVDTLLDGLETAAEYIVQFCDGGYTTNLPLEDVTEGLGRIRLRRLAARARARRPRRMLVHGYHNYGAPWREQRYWGD
jgi:DMSO/TMAO reductase YedYZ molybdopterin-dependent catalytic subunit